MFFWTEYQAWLKVADTALPRNLFGYLLVYCLEPFRCEPFSIVGYDNPKEIVKCGEVGRKSFLKMELPEREGPRPEINKFIAPHRQVSQTTGADMHKSLLQMVDEVVAAQSTLVVKRTSLLEKTGDAILIHDDVPTPHAIAKNIKREIAHVHAGEQSGDYSMHISLSPPDCKKVIEMGWGERMSLAGVFVPLEYLIVYTPRDMQELDVLRSILEAGIGFMTGGKGVGESEVVGGVR